MMKDEQIKQMVNRFLGWKLPDDFNPDGGIKYTKIEPYYPVGTNLFTATQAEEMIRHMLEGVTVSKWVDYKVGDYEKKFYDIKTMAKNTYYGCWPNAGGFNIGSEGQIDEHFVLKIRASTLKPNGMPERMES